MGQWLDVDLLDAEGEEGHPPDLFAVGFQEVGGIYERDAVHHMNEDPCIIGINLAKIITRISAVIFMCRLLRSRMSIFIPGIYRIYILEHNLMCFRYKNCFPGGILNQILPDETEFGASRFRVLEALWSTKSTTESTTKSTTKSRHETSECSTPVGA